MQYAILRKILAVLIGFGLAATGLWASPAGEEQPAAAMEKEMVMDPATGKMVTAPEYGGTLTYPYVRAGDNQDPFYAGLEASWLIDGVNEKLAYGDWALDREEFDFTADYPPLSAFTGNLAESWEAPDPLTYVFHIRQGVHYALNPDSEASRLVNGRELTAKDVEHTYHRYLGLGSGFTEPSELAVAYGFANEPWESIEATDEHTVVIKTTRPSPSALRTIIVGPMHWVLPPDVIEQYGDYKDWKNVVGTGPFMLTDYVDGVSKTFSRNPDYWGFDEKHPENRLPYIDRLRALFMAEAATRISALRTGAVDMIHSAGPVSISTLDVAQSLNRTNPEIVTSPTFGRSTASIAMNVSKPHFDDVRVRHALQMALDLQTINDTYFGGYAKWEPIGLVAVKPYYTPFQEWPAELKGYYSYDQEGAEKLLDEAGYPRGADGVRFKTTLQHRDVIDLGYIEVALQYMADIGVDVTVNIVDTGTLVANRTSFDFEMITGDMAFAVNPATIIGFFKPNQHVNALVGGLETPELTAAYDAFQAATTAEAQQKANREFEMALMKEHVQIWGPLAPRFLASQAWVKGFSGESNLGDLNHHAIFARLWIDQDLKREMGF